MNLAKQVRLDKDACEGRDRDNIAKRDISNLITGCLLQIVHRYI